MLQTTAAVAALAALAGCGGDDDKSSDKPAKSTTSAKPSGRAAAGLPRVVLPTCTVAGFGKPQIQEIGESGGTAQAWSLRFTRRTDPATPPSPSVTTTVVVVETPLSATPNKLPGFKRVTVAGRRVRLTAPGAKSRTYAAIWATKRARFTALANGKSDRTLKQFIACFP